MHEMCYKIKKIFIPIKNDIFGNRAIVIYYPMVICNNHCFVY